MLRNIFFYANFLKNKGTIQVPLTFIFRNKLHVVTVDTRIA